MLTLTMTTFQPATPIRYDQATRLSENAERQCGFSGLRTKSGL